MSHRLTGALRRRSVTPPILTSEERDPTTVSTAEDDMVRSPILQRPRMLENNHNYNEVALLRKQVELLEKLLSQNSDNHHKPSTHKLNEIYLPSYDPDENKITVEEWCNQVDSLIILRGCSEFVAMMKALASLKGRAKDWADTQAHSFATWQEIKKEIITQFSKETRYIVYVNAFRDYTSSNAKTYAEYVSEAWRLFKRISPNAPTDLMVEAVISGIRPKFYQAELLRSAPQSQAELIATLANYRKLHLDATSTHVDEASNNKIPRLMETIKCNKCGKLGHKAFDCRSAATTRPNSSFNKEICQHCKKPGHSSDRCWHKKTSMPERTLPPTQHNVNCIQANPPNCVRLQIATPTVRSHQTHPSVQEFKLRHGHSGGAARNKPQRTLEAELEESAQSALNEVEPYEEVLPDPWELNNTAKAEVEVLFFNRVPKVGSQTFMELLRRLSVRNVFSFNRDAVQRVEMIRLSPPDQQMLVNVVSGYAPPASYIKHVCYTNFTRFGYPAPIYVNVVRDPVERVISWYYYVRAPWYYVERKRAFPDLPLPDPDWLKKDFESCVLRGDRECRYVEGETHEGIGDHRRQTLFFCGHDQECTPFNSIEALQRAKRVVEQQYAVVGVLEDMNSTLLAFERYIPRFFDGASKLYWEELNTFHGINRNAFKPPVSEAIKNIVRSNFTREIEFYEFCRQRLHMQLKALRDPTISIPSTTNHRGLRNRRRIFNKIP